MWHLMSAERSCSTIARGQLPIAARGHRSARKRGSGLRRNGTSRQDHYTALRLLLPLNIRQHNKTAGDGKQRRW
ncbi:hypothetical protein MATL_G00120340 [Megalops atlanticus]|uniref:Uncharacterized protein n=1 Tax=Megalops atlanticus TaxID=7932 RepID=A0A9D3T8B3_MEGAT|nr:hypothetical protein MATL_G00120340 [Megalops atlanticus]